MYLIILIYIIYIIIIFAIKKLYIVFNQLWCLLVILLKCNLLNSLKSGGKWPRFFDFLDENGLQWRKIVFDYWNRKITIPTFVLPVYPSFFTHHSSLLIIHIIEGACCIILKYIATVNIYLPIQSNIYFGQTVCSRNVYFVVSSGYIARAIRGPIQHAEFDIKI